MCLPMSSIVCHTFEFVSVREKVCMCLRELGIDR